MLVPAVHVFAQSPAPALVLTLDVKQPGCAKVIDPTSFSRVGNGSITVLASGGTPPYQYSISPGIFQNNAFFPALDAGNFSITVRDAAGATAGTEAVLSATLPEPSMAVNILSIPSTCTSADGSLELVPYGGAPPYTYSADGGLSFSSSNNIQSGLLQGYFYVFLMKDVNGCEAVAATNVEPHTGNYFMCSSCCPGFIVGAVVQVSCSGNGVLQVKMMGGTPPFLFSLDGVNYQPSDNATHPDWNTFKNLSPGLYHVYSKDAAGSVSQAS
ncbi:MAG TPA: SprB repeat-containing protein, partial [Chitinophagaceae bacterium]